MFGLVFIVFLIGYIVYWWKQRKIKEAIGVGYEENAEYQHICKIKKYLAYLCIGDLLVAVIVSDASRGIDLLKKLFGTVGLVALIAFIYYWIKKSAAKKIAGEDYQQDEKYLYYGKLKKYSAIACLVFFLISGFIPNSPEQQHKQAIQKEQYAKEQTEKELEAVADSWWKKYTKNWKKDGITVKSSDDNTAVVSIDYHFGTDYIYYGTMNLTLAKHGGEWYVTGSRNQKKGGMYK